MFYNSLKINALKNWACPRPAAPGSLVITLEMLAQSTRFLIKSGKICNFVRYNEKNMSGQYTKDKKYVMVSEVPCYDVDSNMDMKPAAFMDLAQEIAYQAATALGFGYDALQTEGKAWVLSRMHYEFIRHPKWRENIELYTWHKGPYGPFYLRDFELKNAGGDLLVRATSSWVILDVANRTMCRTADVMEMIPEDTVCKDNAIERPADKVMMPRGVTPEIAGEHKVEFSDIDLLGHTNNARYVVWAMDCIDFDELKTRPVKDVTVTFIHETRAGEVITLEKVRTENEDGTITWYIDGKADGKSAFCVKINM